MRLIVIIISILIAISILNSCDSSNSNGNNIVMLVDISNSIKPEVLDWYIQTIEKDICANLAQFDKIKVLPIDGASQTASMALLDLDLFEHRKKWDVMGLNANLTDKLKKEAFAQFLHSKMQELRTAIAKAQDRRKVVGNTTDILGGIESAQDKFDPDYNNTIVILSDMEQYGESLKMRPKDQSSQWLAKTSDVKFANISKFSIVVITGEQLAMPKPYYNEIKMYWNEFFTNQRVKSINYQGADASQVKKYIANN